jgi:PhnB protein
VPIFIIGNFERTHHARRTLSHALRPLPPNWSEKIMHCGFMIGQTLVMASDGMTAESVDFSGVSLSITADDEAQAKRLFDALAAGGRIFMQMEKTFWSPCFGMCTDKFGVSWMVGVDGPKV